MRIIRTLVLAVLIFNTLAAVANVRGELITVARSSTNPRLIYGSQKLAEALKKAGYGVNLTSKKTSGRIINISIGVPAAKSLMPGPEGFAISSTKTAVNIVGADASGALYGCLELAQRIITEKKLPVTISFTDKPQMVLRGACIGVQKPTLLPGHGVYEYPYTPETFPWFYDKALWIKYLDMMAENRMNSLYLWNGHPFASLVRVKEYPYAVEVDDATFKKNEEMFSFLTHEADKRGIWVIQMFYNIIVSKPFAEKNGIKTQDRNRPIVPLISDYTRKSIAAFVEKYPNVGLMVALGEAMEGVGQDDIEWFTKTIIPGVKDGLKALKMTTEPPIVLRAHDTDAPAVMKAALPLYKNLYTEAKYNGEALTTYAPRGPWAELHRTLSNIGTVQIENVHILANLEPFRYGSADFIQKSVQAMHSVYGSNGLHLYPQASYWDWPFTADKLAGRLLQVDRDWIWYKAWSRYAWNADRNRAGELHYWSDQLSKKYGIANGTAILEAYEQSGEIAPKLLRRYGITDGNRQTLTLGMLMPQLINPNKFGLFTLLYNSEAPEGEMIIEYAEKEWKKQPHIGETPVQIASEVVQHGKLAVAAIEKAASSVKANNAEFNRLKNDMYCYDALANFYAEKVRAALFILRYKYSNDLADLEKAVPLLDSSVKHFSRLTDLTKDSYLYANSMQTSQRKIPMRGVDGTYKEWKEMLPVYQKELAALKRNIVALKASSTAGKAQPHLQNAEIDLKTAGIKTYHLTAGAQLFSDTTAVIAELAPELQGLNALQFSKAAQLASGTTVTFSSSAPVKVLVGFFNSRAAGYLRAPELETDATANEFGQDEIKIANAISVSALPTVNVHAYSFKAGTNTLKLGKGACIVLGFISDKQPVRMYNAGLGAGNEKDIDWLFE